MTVNADTGGTSLQDPLFEGQSRSGQFLQGGIHLAKSDIALRGQLKSGT